ncbi:hypothetical protein TH468_20955 [Thalassospira sp. MCCC 1A03138]|nr:hypothetical protein TH468_20955 [Thalassospira sp. MCCC 1A03138]
MIAITKTSKTRRIWTERIRRMESTIAHGGMWWRGKGERLRQGDNQEKFAEEFLAARVKVMNADRVDLVVDI